MNGKQINVPISIINIFEVHPLYLQPVKIHSAYNTGVSGRMSHQGHVDSLEGQVGRQGEKMFDKVLCSPLPPCKADSLERKL